MGKTKLRRSESECFWQAYVRAHVENSIPDTDIILRNGNCSILLHRIELQQLDKARVRKIFKFGWGNPDNNAAMTMLIGEIQAQLAEIDATMQKYDVPLKYMRKRLANICDAYTEVYNKMKKKLKETKQ